MNWLTQPIPQNYQGPMLGIALAVIFIAITFGFVAIDTPKPRTFVRVAKNYLIQWGILFGIIVVLSVIGTAWSALNWHGWISEGTVDTGRCATVTQLPPNTLERYYKSFTCENYGYTSQCLHVEWNGSSCEAFTPNW